MNLFGKDLDKQIVLVAEIGQTHEGDVDRAKRMIELANDAGADAVKFQSFTPEKLYPVTMARREIAIKHALSPVEHAVLATHASNLGIPFFSTPVHLEWVEFLDTLGVPAFKIASGDITNTELLKAVAKTGKPVLLSTGGATAEEVGVAQYHLGKSCRVVMHCNAAYPPPIDELNLRAIQTMAGVRISDVDIVGICHASQYAGFSCHLPDVSVCIAAVALGARVVEVHFTDLNPAEAELADFHDHRVSFCDYRFKLLRVEVDKVNSALGDGIKRPMPCEQPFLDLMKEIGRR